MWGSEGGDPKVILLETFVDLAKKKCDRRVDKLDSKNSDLDFERILEKLQPEWGKFLIFFT